MPNARRLGKTDLETPPIGLGCWQMSGGKGLVGGFWAALPDRTVDEVVRASLAAGVTLFDTAEMYGGGESERALARSLSLAGKRPGDVVVATKWNPFLRRASSIRSTIDERLRCLSPFGVDLYQVHQPYGLSSVEDEMNAMADLAVAKKIRHVGVSNFDAPRMRRAHVALAKRGLVLASNQVRYSLLNRRIESNGVLRAARELGVAIIAYSPLAQGLLTGRFHDDPASIRDKPGPRRFMPAFRERGLEASRPLVDALRRIGGASGGASPSEVALAWLVQFHGELVFAIPGASRASQAESNARALHLVLTDDQLAEIDRLSRRFV